MKFIFGLIFILQLVSAQEIKYKKVSYNDGKHVYTKVTGDATGALTEKQIKDIHGYYFKKGTAGDCNDHAEKDIIAYDLNKCITEGNEIFKISRVEETIVKTFYSDNKCEKVKNKQTNQGIEQTSYECDTCSDKTKAYCDDDYKEVVYVKKETTVAGKYEYEVASDEDDLGKEIFSKEELKEKHNYYFITGTVDGCKDHAEANITTYDLNKCITENGKYFKFTRVNKQIKKTYQSESCQTTTPQALKRDGKTSVDSPVTYNCEVCSDKTQAYCKEVEMKYVKISGEGNKHEYRIATIDDNSDQFTETQIKNNFGYYFKTGTAGDCKDHAEAKIIAYNLDTCITEGTTYFKISRIQNVTVKTLYSDNTCKTMKTENPNQESYTCEVCSDKTQAYCKSDFAGVVYLKKETTAGKYEYVVATGEEYKGKEIFTENDIKAKLEYYFKTGTAGDCNDHAQANITSYDLNKCITEGTTYFKISRIQNVTVKTLYSDIKCETMKTGTSNQEIYKCNDNCLSNTRVYCNAEYTGIVYINKVSTVADKYEYEVAKENNYEGKEIFTENDVKDKHEYYFKTGTEENCTDHEKLNIFSYKINTCITDNGKHFKISRIQNVTVKSYYSDNKCEKVQMKEVNKTQTVDQESYKCNDNKCLLKTKAYCKSEYTGVVYVLKKDSTNETTIYEYIVAKQDVYEGKQIFTEEELKEDLGYYFKTGTDVNCTDQDSSDIVTYKLDTCIGDNGTYFKYTKNDTYVTKTLYSDACKTQTGQPETYNCNKCETNKKTNITTNTYCNVWKPSSSSSAPSGPEGPCDSDFGCDGYVEFKEDNKDGFRVFGRLGICYENNVKYIYNVTQKKIAKCDCNKTNCNPVDLKKYENEYELNEGKVFVRRGGYNSSIPCGEQQYQKVYLITGNNNCIKFENVTGYFRYTVSGEKGKETIIEKKASKEDCSDGNSESIYCYKCFKKYTDIPPVKAYCPADQPKINGSSSILIVVMISLLLFFF